jgi:hypothetical protein
MNGQYIESSNILTTNEVCSLCPLLSDNPEQIDLLCCTQVGLKSYLCNWDASAIAPNTPVRFPKLGDTI